MVILADLKAPKSYAVGISKVVFLLQILCSVFVVL